MACFIVPATEAIVTTVASKKLNHTLETKEDTLGNYYIKNMKTLNTMLWGGSALLLFEHIWHGEVTPFFPFFTAASSPAELSAMFHEMATVGVAMALLVTFVWAALTLITYKMTHPKTSPSLEKVHS